MGDVEEGEDLVVTGEFTSHQKFGEQFKVHIFERSLPTTSAAIQPGTPVRPSAFSSDSLSLSSNEAFSEVALRSSV